jgi:6-phosphogluconolactonase
MKRSTIQLRLSTLGIGRLGLALALTWTATQTVLAQPSAETKGERKGGELIDVWIGTGKSQESHGIYHTQLDLKTGKLKPTTLAAEAGGPGFLAMHPKKPVLYAVCDLGQKPVVAAYAITFKGEASALQLLNAVEIGDGGAAHVSVDPTGLTLLTAQYGSGSVGVFSLKDDGSIRERTQLVKHQGGSKVVASRQESSHAHWTGMSPDNRFAFVPDLGLDKVVVYRIDPAASQIEQHGFGVVPPGSGPRHMKFDKTGKFVLVLNELSLAITVFAYDASAGTMTAMETIPTISEEAKAKEQFSSASEIRIHPNNRIVYAANRGHDTISVFGFDEKSGKLTLVEVENARCATPRNFNIDPSGQWLLCGGQDSHTLGVFAVNQETGELTYNRSIVHAPSAICVLFGHE